MTWMEWYGGLTKPAWTPSPGAIGMIWTILYPIIAVSFGYVFFRTYRHKIPGRVALPFAINLTANLLFMPIFSGLRNIDLATVDIVIVWLTLVWAVIAVWPYARWVSLVQLPYWVWVSIAGWIQLSIASANG